MYTLVVREDTIRIPAEYIREGQSLSQHVDRLAHQAFEGKFDDDDNFVVVTYDHKMIDRGRIIHGDGAIYQNVRFKAVLFHLDTNEIVDGAVSEILEFGAFVQMGPLEGLLHKSQILEEPVNINQGEGRIVGNRSGATLSMTNPVRSRVVTLSLNPHDPRSSKIGLTCKQPGLGAHDWIAGGE
ncbi:MAG: DNA-directed RNA polymerase [Thermoplasmata archaeon]|nr:DNA-directed RNA polymerase [Thermoplasmata archaeon]|tara:strand:+ start:1209 stop:1757 length:549 start_codon:yes stop_codon:yes gene_type:complete